MPVAPRFKRMGAVKLRLDYLERDSDLDRIAPLLFQPGRKGRILRPCGSHGRNIGRVLCKITPHYGLFKKFDDPVPIVA
jgi:hypothetical protein